MPIDFTTIITSAAVGGVVGSAISFVGSELERRARRREMLLEKAVELSIHRFESTKNIAAETGKTVTLSDPAIMSATYFRWLEHIADKGTLPDDAKQFEK